MDAFIPDTYIKNEIQKLDIYKRIAGIETEAEYDDMLEELVDRFRGAAKTCTESAAGGGPEEHGASAVAYGGGSERRFHPIYPL